MAVRLLTTGQAAARCAVTPDTVLKWIRSGALPACRTAGGHHRIDERDLDLVVRPSARGPRSSGDDGRNQIQYCWEYNGNGKMLPGCRDCVAYRLRAHRCYELSRLAPVEGHMALFCKESCEGCDSFRHVRGQRTNVLVVSDDVSLSRELLQVAPVAPFNLQLADCEYACSAAVDRFRPDFAVVDCALGRAAARDVCRHIASDPRIPFARIILAANEGEAPQHCEKDIFARIRRPFGMKQIAECIRGYDADVVEETRWGPGGQVVASSGPRRASGQAGAETRRERGG